MAWRVDKVEHIALSIGVGIEHTNGSGFDRYAAFTLYIHHIQHLRLHIAHRHRIRQLHHPVGQRRLAVVNMGDDAKVPYQILAIGHEGSPFYILSFVKTILFT